MISKCGGSLRRRLVLLVGLAASVGTALPVIAQEHNTFAEGGLDPSKAVIFEAPVPSPLHKAISPDGRLRAESGYQKLRVYTVEGDKLLRGFATTGNTHSPQFSADGKTLFAAVCRGNLGCLSTVYSWDLGTGERTQFGQCSGLVLDISGDSTGKRLAVATSFGEPGVIVLHSKYKKWYGGEVVVFDTAKPNDPMRIFCELSGIPSVEKLQEEVKDGDEYVTVLKKRLAEANRHCLPIRVGLTSNGDKIIGVTSTGVVRVFDAETGEPDLVLSSQGRVASDVFSAAE